MPRYVTPEKIYLILLIRIYWNGGVPDKATIPVLAYITSKLTTKVSSSSTKEASNGSNAFRIDISCLRELLKSIPHTKLGEDWHKNLWDAFVDGLARINNFDTLGLFFKHLVDLFKSSQPYHIVLTSTSLLGGFIRKAMLEFEKLLFFDAMKVWREFDICRAPIISEYTGEGAPEHDIHDFDRIAGYKMLHHIDRSLSEKEVEAPSISADVVVRLLDFQIERMQTYGARLPAELRATLQQMITSSGNLPLLHHKRFLDAWYAGDYPSAIDNLHRYYDYAMANKDRSQYQYALLDMAMLHADFGCFNEAALAINETISAAKESKDTHCLTFSLSWLYFFHLRNSGHHHRRLGEVMLGSGPSELNYIAAEARKLGMKSIESSLKLAEAGTCLSKGHRPLEAFERIYESSHLNINHDLMSLMSAELLALSAGFDVLGISSVSRAYCSLVMECYESKTPAESIVRSHCASAQHLFAAGRYTEAFDLLQGVKQDASHNLKLAQYLAQCTGTLKLGKALLNNNLAEAERLLLAVKASPCSDSQFSLTISLLEAKYLTERRSFSAALELLNELLFDPKEQGLSTVMGERIRLMNAKAMLFVTTGRPQKGFSLAMRATTAAYKSRVYSLLWEATGVLARVLCGLQCYDVAKGLLLAVVHQAAETENVALCAFLEESLMLAFVGIVYSNQNNVELYNSAMRDAQKWAATAHKSFEHIEDVTGQQRLQNMIRVFSKCPALDDVLKPVSGVASVSGS